MKISARLQCVASFVTPSHRLADIGTDHGYVPIYLVSEGIIPSALAMDINVGPLERAKEHIIMEGLEDKIKVRLSNGLDKLKDCEADSVLIAGMGGALIIDILERGREVVKSVKELILSPHSEIDEVRKYLVKNDYVITKEEMIYDSSKYYVIMKCIRREVIIREESSEASVFLNDKYEEYEYLYGKRLIESKSAVLTEYLKKEKLNFGKIIDNIKYQDKKELKERVLELCNANIIIDKVLNIIERS